MDCAFSPAGSLAQTVGQKMATIRSVASEATPEEFSKQWVVLTAAIDALRSLLEDSYVNVTPVMRERVQKAIDTAAEDPRALIQVAREVALLEPLIPEKRLREVETRNVTARYIIRIAPPKKPAFILSTGEVRELPVLDDTLTDPRYCDNLMRAFVDLINEAREAHGGSYVAFIDKNFGPVGALGMISSIVQGTGLPATIYRERKWSKKSDLSGHRPVAGEKGIIVYDLFNTGAAIRNAAQRIHEEYQSDIVAATILFNLNPETPAPELSTGRPVVICALDDPLRTRDAGPLPRLNRRAREAASAASAGGTSRSFPKGKEMSETVHWKSDIGAYQAEEVIAAAFKTQRMMDRAISAIWNEPAFRGMPVEIPSGRVLFVPKAAVPLLRARGLSFEEQPVAFGRPRPVAV